MSKSRSPIHSMLEAMKPHWGQVDQTPIALHFGDPEAELAAMKTLALCDVSALPKLGLKGAGAEAWLRRQGIEAPTAIYETCRLSDGGLVVRLGVDEFFLESGIAGSSVPGLWASLSPNENSLHPVERQDATFLLPGSSALEVMAQTCGVDLRKAAPRKMILTQVARVSSSVMPDPVDELPVYRLWVDPSYAIYLWQTLETICRDLGGLVIGAACFHPELNEKK